MRPDISIEAHNLGKRYELGDGNFQNRLRQVVQTVMPSWKGGGDTEEIWAIRNVSFTIGHGEAVGIVGRNGAGKSTLLKVLSRVTKPTEGTAKVRGRVGTLLEVGTGFHPELTGRDNIYLSGTILGMRHEEVRRKFDEIVAFAEVERFIDTPVKRYSSGMYMRLAFAVASFLDPDILIVDEVLAVGDAAFQRKSLGKLNEASQKYGRTILFVSHNLKAIRTFCNRVILLEQGRVIFDGPTEDGIEKYLKAVPESVAVKNIQTKDRLNRTNGQVQFTNVSCTGAPGRTQWRVRSGEALELQFDYETFEAVPDIMIVVILKLPGLGDHLAVFRGIVSDKPVAKGRKGRFTLTLPELPITPNEIGLYAALCRIDNRVFYDVIDENVDLPFIKVVPSDDEELSKEGTLVIPHHAAVSEFTDA